MRINLSLHPVKRYLQVVTCLILSSAFSDSPPPLPKEYKSAIITQGAGAADLITPSVIIAPKTITLKWCYPEDEIWNVSEFRIYHSYTPKLSDMTLYGSTPAKQFVITVNKSVPMEFFAVKAVSALGFESDFGTSGACLK